MLSKNLDHKNFYSTEKILCEDVTESSAADRIHKYATKENQGTPYHIFESHTAFRAGYMPVRKVTICKYEGRYGEGFTVHRNCPHASRYHLVDYYLYA